MKIMSSQSYLALLELSHYYVANSIEIAFCMFRWMIVIQIYFLLAGLKSNVGGGKLIAFGREEVAKIIDDIFRLLQAI